MAKSDFQRKADQVRSQIENLRENMDDVLSSYNRLIGAGADMVSQAQGPMRSMARSVRGSVEDVTDSLPTPSGFSWWIPVAVVGAIGLGIWAFNTFFPQTADQLGDQFSQTAQQVGNQVSQTANQMQSQVAQTANQAREQFSNSTTGNQPSYGQGQTTFGERRFGEQS